ncbi:hypothetical protein [Agrococcus sp. SGAir0287]|uniref:hypothetical protein n=1 Tax=Agrococcus sp. SGAir0287 TaxID=2070347 RepID=UPI0010CD423C|nr:hypothetical protein [Agrococcus sp. SGAir0287]QCR20490.1 hypothetical protein C1N71_14445 [Agrococcus sp. SGAir0287]
MDHDTLAEHPPATLARPHEHGWTTESRHRTSEGVVRYARCLVCGARRVDLDPVASVPPTAASIVVGA